MDKEFLEIVGNGKPTGSALKETIAVSVTMSISVARRMGSPRHALNRRRRTREGPEPACVQTPLMSGWHTQGEKD